MLNDRCSFLCEHRQNSNIIIAQLNSDCRLDRNRTETHENTELNSTDCKGLTCQTREHTERTNCKHCKEISPASACRQGTERLLRCKRQHPHNKRQSAPTRILTRRRTPIHTETPRDMVQRTQTTENITRNRNSTNRESTGTLQSKNTGA